MSKTEIAFIVFLMCCGGWALGELVQHRDSIPVLIVIGELVFWKLIGVLKEAAKDSRRID